MKTKLAITGANGQVGLSLAGRLSRTAGVDVVAVCRNEAGAALLSPLGCEIRIGRMDDPRSARDLLADCPAIIHCALATGLPRESYLRNRRMLEGLASLPRLETIVLASTIAVYGTCIAPGLTSFRRPRPNTVYGRAKLRLERSARRLLARSPARWHILRLGHVYGPYQWLSRDVVNLAGRDSFRLPFDGALPSGGLHVESLAEGILSLLESPRPPGILNATDDPPRTWRQVFDWHTETLGLRPVGGFGPEDSRRNQERFFRERRRTLAGGCVAETFRWLRSLPIGRLVGSAAFREFAGSILLNAPPFLEKSMQKAYVSWSARKVIRELDEEIVAPRPGHCSQEMPGPFLRWGSAGRKSEIELSEELRDWYEETRTDWIPGLREV